MKIGNCFSGSRSASCSALIYSDRFGLFFLDDEAACDSGYTFIHVHSLENTLYYIFRVMTKDNPKKNAKETYRIQTVQHIIPTNGWPRDCLDQVIEIKLGRTGFALNSGLATMFVVFVS